MANTSKTTTSTRTYYAAIGERIMRIEASNVWLAALRAALKFGSYTLEGTEFFAGKAVMELHRSGMDRAVFAGIVDDWRRAFTAQGRKCNWPAQVEAVRP
jgi:hypothetical protein